MAETLWRASLVLALHRNRHVAQARYMQLATVRVDGRPANRTVVFRGFLGDSDRIMVVTDLRSAKVLELEANGWGEACWYFPMTREQFRLGGAAMVVRGGSSDEQARRDTWRALADATRQTFTWPTPGAPRDPGTPFAAQATDADSPPETFGLIVLDPVDVDHLELDGSPQNRWAYHRDEAGQWEGREINP